MYAVCIYDISLSPNYHKGNNRVGVIYGAQALLKRLRYSNRAVTYLHLLAN